MSELVMRVSVLVQRSLVLATNLHVIGAKAASPLFREMLFHNRGTPAIDAAVPPVGGFAGRKEFRVTCAKRTERLPRRDSVQARENASEVDRTTNGHE